MQVKEKTVVLGATTNEDRTAWVAIHRLLEAGQEVVPVGIRKGEVAGLEILNLNDFPQIEDVDTLNLYIGEKRQPPYYDYILGLKPRRILFNPGTWNPELAELAKAQGIAIVHACSLVMLATGSYSDFSLSGIS